MTERYATYFGQNQDIRGPLTQSVDGIARVQRPASSPTQKTQVQEAKRPAVNLPKRQLPAKPRQSIWQRLQMPIILISGLVGGFFAQTTLYGVIGIIIYGIFATVLHIPSRTSFALAGLSFAAVSFLFLFKPNLALASTFTTYAFLFLVVGVIAISRESRPRFRRKRRRRVDRQGV